MPLKQLLSIALGFLLLVWIGSSFYFHQLVYLLPTPVPKNYQEVSIGTKVLAEIDQAHYYHFYNPNCPCSRFNKKEVMQLINRYKNDLKIICVLPAFLSTEETALLKEEFDNSIDFVIDYNEELAGKLGIYATPQAAIIDKNGHLYYRGNYYLSRYCTKKESSFVQIALEHLSNQKPPPFYQELKGNAYGCSFTKEPNFSFLSLSTF